MTLLQQFIGTVFAMATSGHWSELRDYIKLIKELRHEPTAVITPHPPVDKP